MSMTGFNKTTQTRFGPMIYNQNDVYIGKSLEIYGEFSFGEAELFEQIVRDGMYVVELGANIGAHTIMLAQKVAPRGRVIAFEPQRIVYQSLCGNISLNSLLNVYAYQVAIGSEAGTITVPVLDYAAQNNFGGLQLGAFETGEEVELRTLDSYALSSCDFLKLDIEGMEESALRGAVDTITRCRPIMYIENDREEKSDSLASFISSLDYEMYWHLPPFFNKSNFNNEKVNHFGNIVSKNLLCMPKEGSHVINGLERFEPSASGVDRSRLSLKGNLSSAKKVDSGDLAGLFKKGLGLHEAGKLGEAKTIYDAVLERDPQHADALHYSGVIAYQMGELQPALTLIDEAIRLSPDNADAHSNRGNMLRGCERLDEALVSYDHAIRLKPDFADAYSNRAIVLRNLKRLDEALGSCDQAIQLKPDYPEAHNNRAVVLRSLQRLDEALVSCDQSIRLKPGYADAYNNRGNVLRELGKLDEALTSYNQAIELKLDYADAYFNRGVILTDLERVDEALVSYDLAIRYKPGTIVARYNKSFALLRSGRFEEGWPLYELRWTREDAIAAPRDFPQPLWLGKESISGKIVLLHSEQGLGDTLQFVRYVNLVAERAAEVILEVPAAMIRLLKGSNIRAQLLAKGDALPDFDYHCPLLSLPLAFGTTVDSIPRSASYLEAEPSRVIDWKSRLADNCFNIGIAWQGRKSKIDIGRSFPLALLQGIAQLPDVRLYSLQKGEGAEQLDELPGTMEVELFEDSFDAEGAFIDTAAVMENLDLIITSDTAVAHLAGALGRPVWVALKYGPDWRWLLGRDTSPWYPSMRLFRQSQPGDWKGVFEAMKGQLLSQKLGTFQGDRAL